MEKQLNEQEENKEQKNNVNDSALTDEMYRAVEMMKRVRKSTIVHTESEAVKMPSYLMPDAMILCQTGN